MLCHGDTRQRKKPMESFSYLASAFVDSPSSKSMVASQNAGQSKPGANSPVRMSALRAASVSPLKQSATPSAFQEYALSGSSSVAFRAAAIASGIRPSGTSTWLAYKRNALASEGFSARARLTSASPPAQFHFHSARNLPRAR